MSGSHRNQACLCGSQRKYKRCCLALHHTHHALTHTASTLMHTGDRWAWNHTSNIQAAYFNGDGFVSWENVWGIWQGMTPRDSAALRAVSRVLWTGRV